MHTFNRITLLGRAGHTPELTSSKNGKPYTRINIATHRRWKIEENKYEDRTDWHSIMVWGNLAQICTQKVSKGTAVFVEGSLVQYEHINESGRSETRYSVHAHHISFFKNGNSTETTRPPAQAS